MQTLGFKFDKPVRKKKKNHSRRNKTRTKAGMIKDLDDLTRLDVKNRDGWKCQRCSKAHGEWDDEIKQYIGIQWAHIQKRDYHCLRWEMFNGLALCQRCHVWFDNHKLLAYDWFSKNFADRWEMIRNVLLSGNTKTTDAQVRELWQERCGEARRIP